MKTMFVILVMAAMAAGQVCTVDEVPEWRKLKIGMTSKEFRSQFPGTQPINMFTRQQLERVRGYSGLELIAFRMSNGVLDQFEARYSGQSGGTERLAKRVSRELGLPFDAWKITADKADMTCLKFAVGIDAATNGFTITDLAAQKYWDAMREKSQNPR